LSSTGAAKEKRGESNKTVAHTQIPTLTANVSLRLILSPLPFDLNVAKSRLHTAPGILESRFVRGRFWPGRVESKLLAHESMNPAL